MNYFRKCSDLDIPKNAKVYIFYVGLHLEYHNIIDALIEGSILEIPLDNTLYHFLRIAEINRRGQLKGKFSGK